MISRYMVLVASEQKLLMMRPYQIYAVKNIVECIDENRGNGYVWHTTGSGKTLTSFKASTLLKANPAIEKCLFVVDRKDLDRQTREEFNRFQEGCVEENTNTGALVRRLLSDDAADKVIVCTIQKLGLALDENSKRNKSREKRGWRPTRTCSNRCATSAWSSSSTNATARSSATTTRPSRSSSPRPSSSASPARRSSRRTPATSSIEGDVQTLKTTQDLFQQSLHEYTITHAIEDRNVLRFHVDYYKPDGKNPPKPGETLAKRAIVDAILAKHDAATGGRKFNAILATASINDAIEYYEPVRERPGREAAGRPRLRPAQHRRRLLPAGDVSADVKQIQEDLPQEQEDNKHDPEGKKKALQAIIADYNARFGTNHRIEEFDLYYQDVQQRIKDQQFPNADLPKKGREKLDITIVVDMLLTGFDSKYLNTLYVDKNLKHHGLIQAFSRTNRVLNDTKPYGHILDFRGQQDAVDAAIALFSGAKADKAREIWLVDKAPVVIDKLKEAKQALDELHAVAGPVGQARRCRQPQGRRCPRRLHQALQGSAEAANPARPVHRPDAEQEQTIQAILPKDELNAFRGQYLETAQRRSDSGVKLAV